MKDTFPSLLYSTLNSEGLGNYRTLAADTLSVWFQRAVQSSSEATANKIGSFITDSEAEQVFSFICDFWTDSGAALGNALKELFIKLISLLSKVRTNDSLNIVLESWTRRILKFGRNQRVLYFTLEVLVKYVGGSFVLQEVPSFQNEALGKMGSNALANPIGKTLFAIYNSILTEKSKGEKPSKISDDIIEEWTQLWSPATRSALLNPKTREHVQTYFLPQMFKRSPRSLKVFVQPFININFDTSIDEISVLIGCLKLGQETNILDISNQNVIPEDLLRSLFYHRSSALRISALSLVVTSHQVSKPVPVYVLDIIKSSIDNFFVESDPGFRNQFYGFMRQMVFRIRGSSYAMARDSRKLKEKGDIAKAETLDQAIEVNQKFFAWFVDYLEACIRPGSPYQFLFTGILFITLLVQSGLDERVSSQYYEKQHIPFPFHVSIYNKKIVRLLIDNIANNYEDIRSGSAKILKMAPLPVPLVSSYDEIEDISIQVFNTIGGMRGREGDAGAKGAELVFHLYGALPSTTGSPQSKSLEFLETLITMLEKYVEYAKSDLSLAVREHPIHGYYAALRFIIENIKFSNFIQTDKDVTRWKSYIKRLTDSIFEIWNIVEAILCHDSPEGNLPEELESNFQPNLEKKYGPATQVILSYSWRAIKESTSLLDSLLSLVPINAEIFPNSLVIQSGEVILQQLAGVHHRGAFSSVYPTFISCCKRCNRTKGLESQPGVWLTENLSLIKTKAQYITRRSGGLPFLITAVLTAETDPTKPLLNMTFDALYQIAKTPAVSSSEEKMDLPQVHAFNCIKALFIETELSNSSTFFVDRALELAITSFSHPIWAIRNCAVMLFTALQNRLFGTTKVSTSRHVISTVPARLFFSKYKALRQVLLNIQEEYLKSLENNNGSNVEVVFPVLSLLARLEATNGYQGLNDFKPLISVCLKSKLWKIREMAARVYPPLLNDCDIFEFSRELLNSFDSKTDQNGLHGALLAIHNIINKEFEKYHDQQNTSSVGVFQSQGSSPIPVEFIQYLFTKFYDIMIDNNCSESAREFYRILSAIYMFNIENFGSVGVEEFETVFIPYSLLDRPKLNNSLNAVERELQSELAQTSLKTYFNLNKAHSGRLEYIKSLLLHDYYEVQLVVIEFLDQNLTKLTVQEAKSISSTCWKLFNIADWDQVKGPAATLFSKLQTISSSSPTEAEPYWNTLYKSIKPEFTEEIVESCLEALGNFTGQLKSPKFTKGWFDLVKEYSHENHAFPARQSALVSLLSFLKLVQLDSVNEMYLEALLQLLFFLSDDDEDIREIAAGYSSKYLDLNFQSTSVYCEHELLKKIVDLANTNGLSNYLAAALFTKLTLGKKSSQELQSAFTDDNLLFSFEKQNIYRDELNTIKRFKNALVSLNPSFLAPEYNEWLSDAFKSYMNIKTQGTDGVWGWSKDSEIFLALYRIQQVVELGTQLKIISPDNQISLTKVKNLGTELKLHDMVLLS